MITNRRWILAGLGATGLSACAGGGSAPASRTQYRAVPNAAFDAWLDGFRGRAAANGVSGATIDRAFRSAGYLPEVIERDRNQTEFRRSLEDYLALTANDDKVAQGRQMMSRYNGVLSQIEARYGVEKEIVVAIWGIESQYGTRRGDVPVVSSTATLAYDGRRRALFEKQLVAAMKILQAGDVSPEGMVGSWAGAMGHTQFIPTSYLAFAVDFNGDGRRDIWSDDPTDSLASTAAYLDRNGWRFGQPWMVEALPGTSGGSVIQPQQPGPSFRTYANFGTIKTYNNSTSYALAVSYLANRVAGGAPLRTPFGPDAGGLTLADRQELQQRLTRAGYDTGGTDGVIGPKSIAAIEAYQRANGLPVTGQGTAAMLAGLR
ncbi:MAG: peptidoglycan-binding protein [Rhodobacteraceae bacterium]|nr:peptidoglycan-binding protein [Paracoccaceae bacterium]MAY46178.1 peptidoglycan-binding protein [Paracoccaceae bacterium]